MSNAYDEVTALLREKQNGLTFDQLIDINRIVINMARDTRRSQSITAVGNTILQVGDPVQWTRHRKSGAFYKLVRGKVERINQTTITICDCDDGGPGWRVHPSKDLILDPNGFWKDSVPHEGEMEIGVSDVG